MRRRTPNRKSAVPGLHPTPGHHAASSATTAIHGRLPNFPAGAERQLWRGVRWRDLCPDAQRSALVLSFRVASLTTPKASSAARAKTPAARTPRKSLCRRMAANSSVTANTARATVDNARLTTERPADSTGVARRVSARVKPSASNPTKRSVMTNTLTAATAQSAPVRSRALAST